LCTQSEIVPSIETMYRCPARVGITTASARIRPDTRSRTSKATLDRGGSPARAHQQKNWLTQWPSHVGRRLRQKRRCRDREQGADALLRFPTQRGFHDAIWDHAADSLGPTSCALEVIKCNACSIGPANDPARAAKNSAEVGRRPSRDRGFAAL
jgi:hypothetical protein